MAAEPNPAPLIVIVGETASGKSKLAISVAKTIDGEIICGDSRTIFSGMDIGTAKPDRQDRNEIRHHLLDVVNPNEKFTVVDFQEAAKKVIDSIWKSGKWPVLVGGSGLYVDSILFDYQFRKINPAKRQRLLDMEIVDLVELAKSRELFVADPKNKRYLVRLLESEEVAPDNRQQIRENTLVIGVRIDRTNLRKNIEARTREMFKRGLVTEVESLKRRYSWEDPGMTGIGYREFRPFFSGETSLSKTKQMIIYDSLQLAKRQRTWFKRNRFITWIDDENDVKKIVQEFISKHSYDK